jgi:hypothetical protein
MPAGRYAVLDGKGNPVGTEDFRCAPGPVGWRYFAEITTSEPFPHEEVVDLVTDAERRPVRTRIHTGDHDLLLQVEGDELRGFRDGTELSIPWNADRHLDYLSPSYNAVTGMRLDATAEIDVVFVEPVTLEPRDERQRYELLGDEEIDTPAGRFAARRWRYTALSSGWTSELWIAGDVVVAYDRVFTLESYDPGATGAHPLA